MTTTNPEAAVIGAALTNPSVVSPLRVFLPDASAFTVRPYALAWTAILALADAGQPVDLVSVTQKARAGGASIGGDLAEAMGTASGSSPEFYAGLMREAALRRSLTKRATAILQACVDPTADVFDILDSVRLAHEAEVSGLPSRAMISMEQALATLDARRAEPDAQGVPSVVDGLTSILGGWKAGKLYVGAGRPAMGKSAHAKSEAIRVAETGRTVCVFTMEMGADEYAERIEDEVGREAAASLPIQFHDLARMTTHDVRAKIQGVARELRAAVEPPVGLVVVDYLQLMRGLGDNREQEVSQITRDLKAIAREMRVPVLALSQLNRAVESRTDKRPQLSDLRESGAIEQDADVVLFYYRPEYYGAEVCEVNGSHERAKGLCEIIVSKQRKGETGSVWAAFDGPRTAFGNRSGRRTLTQSGPVGGDGYALGDTYAPEPF